MPDLVRRFAGTVVPLVALAVIVAGVVIGEDRDTDRVESLSQQLRCPVCQGESIADSPSDVARDYRDIIAERVAAGDSDDAIIDTFVAAYGEWVLLDPPARGRNLLLWLLPAGALLLGIGAIVTRKRPAVPAGE